jgi:adenylate cyclase
MFGKSRIWAVLHWRGRLRLASALVLLSFVICHLTAHCLLLVSFEDAEATRNVVMYPWRTWIGTAILIAAFVTHFSNALWSIYIRRALRLTRWEWTQLALGLCIPPLLMFHVVATRIAEVTNCIRRQSRAGCSRLSFTR